MKNRDSSRNLQYQWTRGILKEKNEYVCFVYIFRNIYINVCIHKILNMNFSCLLEQKNMSRSNKPVLTIHPGIFFQQNISTRKFLKCQVGEGFPNCSHLPAVCGYWSWWCFLKLHLTSKRVGPETTSRRACESVGGHWSISILMYSPNDVRKWHFSSPVINLWYTLLEAWNVPMYSW